MDPLANPQMPAQSASHGKKTLVIVIALAVIATAAYYMWPSESMEEPINATTAESKELPALSESDDIESIKADLGSTTITDADLSSFDGGIEVKEQ